VNSGKAVPNFVSAARFASTLAFALGLAAGVFALSAQTSWSTQTAKDPGVDEGPARSGAAIAGLSIRQRRLFDQAAHQFNLMHSVKGTLRHETADGLGPTFNLNSCGGCHVHPAAGGTSPPVNPQLDVAHLDGAKNTIPAFVTLKGPIRIARFIRRPDGSPDGEVHALFTIKGRVDAPGCQLSQPDFAAELANHNVGFRIPTPLFGSGLLENIPEETILANKAADAERKKQLGIEGHESRNPNDGTITRFGWKAQNKSLLLFSGEAYNVEMGVTNELFPNERGLTPDCNFNATPEDHTPYPATYPVIKDPNDRTESSEVFSDLQQFATFSRFLAPPSPSPETPSIRAGKDLFSITGCALCHTPTLKTARSPLAALSLQPANLYSDLLLHRMGEGLADGIQQGLAGPDEFRTAPLWGLGQRYFLLHDGRTSDLIKAIQAHRSVGSEASAVIDKYDTLTQKEKQDLLNFLRSL
jgi:CxxC motif-containing protein (DUF1111 family)